MNQFDPDQLLDRGEGAAFLTALGFKISKQTLATMACTSTAGPEYSLFCGRALYRAGQLKTWAEGRASKPRRSTLEAAVA